MTQPQFSPFARSILVAIDEKVARRLADIGVIGNVLDGDRIRGVIQPQVIRHDILDGSVHGDSVADAVTEGSLIHGNATPAWDELAISIPGSAGARNVLSVDFGETNFSWKGIDLLVDADGDTKIQVEESADEDIIRFDVGGTEFATMGEIISEVETQLHLVMVADKAILLDGTTNPRTIDSGLVRVEITPSIENTRAFTINMDVNSQPSSHAHVVNIVATQIAAGEIVSAYDVNVDAANSSGGIVRGFEMSIVGTAGIVGHLIHADPNIWPVTQDSGSFINVESAWENAVDVTADFNSAASDVELFSADNDVVYMGMAAKFDHIEVILATMASGAGIKPTFGYSDGVGGFTAYTPADETQGFRQGGVISWDSDDLAGWATDTVNGVANKYWISITRTANALTTPPVEDTIQVQTITAFSWDASGNLIINSVSTDTISERTAATGVTIDGVELKDGLVDGVDVAARDHAKYTDAEAVLAVEAETTLEFDAATIISTAAGALTVKATTTLILQSAAGQSLFIDCGANFVWRDASGGFATSMVHDASTGKLDVTGEVEINGNLNHDGSNIGFFGTAPAAKQTGVAVTAAAIHAALVAYGMIAGP